MLSPRLAAQTLQIPRSDMVNCLGLLDCARRLHKRAQTLAKLHNTGNKLEQTRRVVGELVVPLR